ncbi:MAG: endonuclease/exonuclease/phosphatase family protein [Alistipes indistinctus]
MRRTRRRPAALESPLPANRRTDPIPRLRHHRHAGGPPGTDGRPAYGAARVHRRRHGPRRNQPGRALAGILPDRPFRAARQRHLLAVGNPRKGFTRLGCRLQPHLFVGQTARQAEQKEFFYFNTHLDHMGPVARHEGAELICRRIASLAGDKYPVFCTGDFNAEPKDEPIKVMLQHLASARDVSQTPPYDQGSEVSWTGVPVGAMTVTIPEAQRGRQAIDHVFVNGRVDVLKYGLLRDSDGINYPSDHIPILVRATLK